jgi:signal transduction histidine kinase
MMLRRRERMKKPAVLVTEDQPLTLSNSAPGRSQKRLAVAVLLAFVTALFLSAGEISNVQLGRVDAFVPVYGTAIFVNDLITAVLLFNQFAILRSRALLVISNAYLFTALMVIPWTLTFPGVFAPGGLLGAGLQSTNWLYVLRYAAFPSFVMAYTFLKDEGSPEGLWERPVGATILSSIAISAAIVCGVTIFVTAGNDYLPRISIDPVHFSSLWLYLAGCLIVWNGLAFAFLWLRQRSVLDLWLMVVVCAYAIEIYLVSFPGLARFSAGWYAGRTFGFVSSLLVLFALLHEIASLYAQLLSALLAQRHEREARLMTGDAVSASVVHEVKQPLTAIIASASAGLNWLDRVEPDLDNVRNALRRVLSNGERADVLIDDIRAHFKVGARARTSLDINGAIDEALTLVRDRLLAHWILVQTSLGERLPRVMGEPIQLQQVLVNLMTNAIESMATNDGERALSIKSELHQPGEVVVSVKDTGKGFEAGVVDRIFEPMFTTKAHGMGMGLSICRSIVEAHEGRLWVTAGEHGGAAFHFTVPVASDRT